MLIENFESIFKFFFSLEKLLFLTIEFCPLDVERCNLSFSYIVHFLCLFSSYIGVGLCRNLV